MKLTKKKHRMYCAKSDKRCAVYHPDGICPDVRDCEACKEEREQPKKKQGCRPLITFKKPITEKQLDGIFKKFCQPQQQKWEERFDKEIGSFEDFRTMVNHETIPTKESLALRDAKLEAYETLKSFISQEIERARRDIVKKVESIIEPKVAKRIADINEQYMGDRACKMCGQNPEDWCRKLLSELTK